MARQVSTVSDIDGSSPADYGVVIRVYPGLDSPRLLDLTKEQADALAAKSVKDVLPVEVRDPDGSSRQVLITKPELDKFLGEGDVLKNAAYLRGRKAGTVVGNNH